MIRRASPSTSDPKDASPDPEPQGLELAFVTLWATGPDAQRDPVFRIQALRVTSEGRSSFDRFCAPFRAETGDAGATQRMVREFGVQGAELEGAEAPPTIWTELVEFLGGLPTIVIDREEFTARARHLGGGEPDQVVGLSELAELLAPGRTASMGEALCEYLVPSSGRPSRAIGPKELAAAVGTLVGSFLELPDEIVALTCRGLREATTGLTLTDPDARDTLEFVLRLLAAPEQPLRVTGGLFAAHAGLKDGALAGMLATHRTVKGAFRSSEPAWTTPSDDLSSPLPIEPAVEAPFDPGDMKLVDDIFQHHLPKLFGGDSYREGQHGVACEVARALDGDELLLVHAPTGTGKTLAYLVPTMMWAARNDLRLGVATFTRALQEQAMDREVPLALELLRRAGYTRTPRVAVLKGRQNYLCWRALESQMPQDDGDGLRWLAWTRLVLFALTDNDGDLDRFARRSSLPLADPLEAERELRRIVGQVRAQSGCCRTRRDRATCAAETARRRAERSHVVLTNHSYALARQGFFKYLVFDECEHLHDQAHAAFSHVLSVPGVRELLAALRGQPAKPTKRSRPRPLDRIRDAAMEGTPAHACAEECSDLQAACLDSLVHLERALAEFKAWRESAHPERTTQDTHSLFREYATSERADELLDSHQLLVAAWNELCAALATLSEHLEDIQMRGKRRIRRALDLVRADLEEHLNGLIAWIPREEGMPRFRPETFYDVETDVRGRDAMAARVLLPHEYLGRFFYPELRAAVCISATTHLAGGFESSAAYLGLERAARPAPNETREPSPYRTYFAPSPFDYGRVLVAVPRDAPTFRNASKEAFLDYTCRFVTTLAEKTRGRMLVLFTNASDCVACGRRVEGAFAERGIPLFYQRMEGAEKEELAELFRSRTDSVLFGLDTFWYGADFPGETLEYLVIVKLPYGVPDRYHHAQCAAIGPGAQRKLIYMPRSLAKFRQGFGRLMRKETDRGCVFVLDGRVLDPRHRAFLKELPIDSGFERGADGGTARLVRGDTAFCQHEALAHMGMLSDVRRHEYVEPDPDQGEVREGRARYEKPDEVLEIEEGELPF